MKEANINDLGLGSAPAINQNWVVGRSPEILEQIHDSNINIAIYDRSLPSVAPSLDALLEEGIDFRGSGSKDQILNQLSQVLDGRKYRMVLEDIADLIDTFGVVAGVDRFRCFLATVLSDMCRKFHTDMNDLRLLCSYRGPGTLWLQDQDTKAGELGLGIGRHDGYIVHKAPTEAVLILKGAAYPRVGTEAVMHRSPSIEESRQKRLVLRIDTNDTNDIWL